MRWLRRLFRRTPPPEPPVDDRPSPEEIEKWEREERYHDKVLGDWGHGTIEEGRALRIEVEDNINASFGLPEVWRCPCGGRPFKGRDCPRCHRSEQEALG